MDLAKRVKPAIDLIDQAAKNGQGPSPMAPAQASPTLDGAALATIIGTPGEQTGPVYKITLGRPDINLREHGAAINARMGLNTWAAFAGTDADAMVAGDVALLENEVTPVLKSLRANGINVVAIHHHMTDITPIVFFLHYYGTGRAATLAEGVRAAIDLLGRPQARKPPMILFMCPHGAAKSVLASAYFQRLAKERGLNVRVLSRGTDPDPAIAPVVARHLAMNGYEVPAATPRLATSTDVGDADVVVSLGCDLKNLPVPAGKLKEWNDVPAPSEDFTAADEAIKKRVAELVEELIQATRTP